MDDSLRQAACYAVAGVIGLAAGVPVSDFARCVEVLIGRSRVPPLDRLAEEVARDTRAAIGAETEKLGAVGGTLLALLEHHAPDVPTLVRAHNRDPRRVADALVDSGAPALAGLNEGERGLLRRVLAELYRQILRNDRHFPDIERETFTALLEMRHELARLPKEIAEALLRLRDRLALHAGRLPLLRIRTDSALLRAEYAVVPFHPARAAELAELRSWAAMEVDADVRLLHGPGGMGKTRLAMELADGLRGEEWDAGFLRREADAAAAEAFAGLVRGARPLLVVVDYAETRQEVVRELLAAANRHGRPKVRVLLLARSIGDWWEAARRSDPDAQELTAHARAVELRPVPDGPDTRRAFFEAAGRAFAGRLGIEAPAAPAPDLADPGFGRPLFLAVAALAAVRGTTVASAEGALRWILDRERRQWDGRLEASGLAPELFRRVLAQAAALAVLAGGAGDEGGLRGLVAATPEARGVDGEKLAAIARILTTLYPERAGLGVLKPDILGEELVAGELDRDDGLLAAALAEERSEAELVNAFTVLARLAVRRPEAALWLDAALTLDPARLLAPALEAAKQFPDQLAGPLGRAWAGLPETERAAVALALHDRLPHHTVALAGFALAVTEALGDVTDLLAHLSGDDAIRATALNNLSNRLSALGRREEALPAIEEAVALYRRLAARNPDAFEPYLALSLNNLSNVLSALGRRKEALAASKQAVALYRRLAERSPDAFEPYLAMSLNNLSGRLSALRRREEALAAIEEAVAVYRRLAARNPDAFAPDLARSLNNLSVRLSDLGRREEALPAIEEAVALYRRLAARNSAAFAPDLASSLNNLSNRLAALGRREEALAAIEEAVALYRRLAARAPDAFGPDLARSLGVLGFVLDGLGRPEDALEAFEGAVRTLLPHFLRLPQAHAELMAALAGDYLRRCLALGRAPDAELLAPVAEVLQRLHGGDPPAGA